MRVEARLSRMARWVLDAAREGTRFGLELPATIIEPDRGSSHSENCLTALALYRQ